MRVFKRKSGGLLRRFDIRILQSERVLNLQADDVRVSVILRVQR